MLATFEARVFHGLLEPLEHVDLPEGQKVMVTVTDETEITQPEETGEQYSKWVVLAEKIESSDNPFTGLGQSVLDSVKEFREDFTFKHDE